MTARLAAGILVSALIRRVENEGGSAAVLARGDATGGALLIQLAERGVPGPLIEPVLDRDGNYVWGPTGPQDAAQRADYIARRRKSDPDLWVLELDSTHAARIVADVAG